MNRGITKRIGLSLLFSLAVLLIFVITALISAAISFLVIQLGLVEPSGTLPVIITLISIIAVGTFFSLMMGRFPLKAIQKVIAATNQLANGNFSTRLNIVRPTEFKKLSDSFNRMAAELGRIELLRTDFVNNFSHEFKTPIVSIKGFAEILKRDNLTVEERVKYLDIIIKESDRLASLATNVLNLSKVENQSILSEKQTFDLGEQVRRCIVLLQSKWERKQISLSIDVQDIFYVGNEELLEQVWLNLFDNAVKFTPEGGVITITLKQTNQTAQFILQDSGCGISGDDIEHVFNRFYQADALQAVKGHGLGLAVAQKIVKLHGGDILCHSEANKGTEFIVTLPLS